MKCHLEKPISNSRRGFTLTEMAIVAGVIGVIVGGVWALGSRVVSYMYINRAIDQLNQIVENTRALYGGRTLASGGPLLSGAQTISVFPKDMVVVKGFKKIANNVWAADTGTVGTAQVAMPIVPASSTKKITLFAVRYTNVPPAICPQLAMRTSDTSKGLIGMGVSCTKGVAPTAISSSTVPPILSLPLKGSAAVTACNVPAPPPCIPKPSASPPGTCPPPPPPTCAMDWYYNFTGGY